MSGGQPRVRWNQEQFATHVPPNVHGTRGVAHSLSGAQGLLRLSGMMRVAGPTNKGPTNKGPTNKGGHGQ